MSREDARRTTALEDIARELRETNRQLRRIADNTRPVTSGGLNIKPPDPFGVPEVLKDKDEPTEGFIQSTHPYFKRTTEGTNAAE